MGFLGQSQPYETPNGSRDLRKGEIPSIAEG